MFKRQQACSLLKQGNSPSEIARMMRVGTSDVLYDLWSKIGEGELLRSDIAFSLKRHCRKVIEEVVAQDSTWSPARITLERELLERLLQLNRIRSNVMHPVRGGQLAEEEFEFVFNLDADLGPLGLPEAQAAEKQDKPLTVPGEEQPSAETKASVAPELVSKLSPLDPVKPAQEFATNRARS